ncbi:MAG: ExbD/TolR family protein [Planctomycetota bacterium]|jgi:biopolymer transport protein ExbD|nr:biopolymer transporter ExbD [Blastopirellula sp.]
MSNRDSDRLDNSQKQESFDLLPPGASFNSLPGTDAPPPRQVVPPKPKAKADASAKEFSWKGFEEPVEEVEQDPPVGFSEGKKLAGDDGLDMTPMIDVTFLLLIFFMLTASFTVQESLETPHSKVDEPSTQTIEEQEDNLEYVEVIIDQNNTYYITTRGEAEVEAGSDRDMQARVRSAKEEYNAVKLIITAHVDSLHGKMVKAWDTGVANGFEKIEVRTTELNY